MGAAKFANVSTGLICFLISGLAIFNCGPMPMPDSDVPGTDASVIDTGSNPDPDVVMQPDTSPAEDHVVPPTDSGPEADASTEASTEGGVTFCSPSMENPAPTCPTGSACRCNIDITQMPDHCTDEGMMEHCTAAMTCQASPFMNQCSPHLPRDVDGRVPFACEEQLRYGIWSRADFVRDIGVSSYEPDMNGLLEVVWSATDTGAPYSHMACTGRFCYSYAGISADSSYSIFEFDSSCMRIDLRSYGPGGVGSTSYIINWVRRAF